MDLDAVRVFVRIAELGSFTRASEQLGLSKARASIRVQELEAELGSRLLARSTRSVRLTEDGEQFFPRAKRLILDADELASLFQTPSNLRGRVRIDLPIGQCAWNRCHAFAPPKKCKAPLMHWKPGRSISSSAHIACFKATCASKTLGL